MSGYFAYLRYIFDSFKIVTMKKLIVPALMIVVFLAISCKDKKNVTPVKTSEPVVEQSVPAPPPVQQQEEVVPPQPVEPDRYFLIAGSFMKQENAAKLESEWRQKGYETQIVTRSWGANSDFYRVAYMGFSDRKQAINAMEQERALPGKEDVWVLVKK